MLVHVIIESPAVSWYVSDSYILNLSFQDDAQQKYIDYVKDLEGK